MLTPADFLIVKEERLRLGRDLRHVRTGVLTLAEEESAVLEMAVRNLDMLIAEYNRQLPN